MANDEKKQDQRDGIAHRLGGWVHVAVIACYMAVLFVQPAAAADDMWTRFSNIIAMFMASCWAYPPLSPLRQPR